MNNSIGPPTRSLQHPIASRSVQKASPSPLPLAAPQAIEGSLCRPARNNLLCSRRGKISVGEVKKDEMWKRKAAPEELVFLHPTLLFFRSPGQFWRASALVTLETSGTSTRACGRTRGFGVRILRGDVRRKKTIEKNARGNSIYRLPIFFVSKSLRACMCVYMFVNFKHPVSSPT